MVAIIGEKCKEEKNQLNIPFKNIRFREEGRDIILQFFNGKINEQKVGKEEVKKLFTAHPLPEQLWDVLSNESIVSLCNDLILSRGNGSITFLHKSR